MTDTFAGKILHTTITADGTLRLELVDQQWGPPGADEVVVRVEATPINPSDLGLLIGPADLSTLAVDGGVLTAKVPERRLGLVKARLGEALPVGNEGAGTVVAAGSNAGHLLGKKVGMLGGAMYGHYRQLPVRDCIVLPDGASAADGAAMFVNPLTALGFVETMRAEGHKAIVHTAAASNLGQMLNRICLKDGVPLVCVVRSAEQVALLKGQGAEHVLDSSADGFDAALVEAVAATGATLAFDALGGGTLGSRILAAMEAAANKGAAYSRYGSTTFKQLYIYGGLDLSPTTLGRNFGFSWSVGGWLLTPFLQKAGRDVAARLRQRVADELTTTFASHYTATISLADVLNPEMVRAYDRKATGEKFLIDPRL
ncbi:NADH oxidoreductase [Polymorphobacter multimanifer]|uniref:NADPH:quinone reductase-like Zn-dependent oxidoreductase n=1 Tax=Polymorphobacter multimanifer TaxID=1070431 RepID=A0A841LGT3_9SPHN|nr:zinc-binding dehydrogenase [Polymorphobacter multimanifer]MBB6228402.1 NADPH:quinone reductase-like Zn-dependent oxidoreductase [Polymorphobacter multimanifer]GGI92226.1 NADH oxidoreductase [Polymorphobacter multimanifer]